MPISQSEYARRRGVSRQYVSRLVKEGVIRLKNGKVDPAQADAALAARRDPARPLRRKKPKTDTKRTSQAATQDSSVSVDAATLPGSAAGDLPKMLLKTRIKSELEKGKLLEIKARVEAGKYVDADEVKVAAFNKARIVCDGLLNIPDRLAALLAAESDEHKVHKLLASEIRAVLEELSGGAERG
ncbi:MAG TPA: hypothetical protein ENJ62_02830 [Bryobacterales bacterium]|nr:hypothetical protein [Bryobacterales bacterium]